MPDFALNRRAVLAAGVGLAAASVATLSLPGTGQAATLDSALQTALKGQRVLRDPVTDAAFDGRPVLVTFFASWCPPCRAEMGHLQSYIDKHGDTVSMIAVNWMEDFAGPIDTARLNRFLDVVPASMPVIQADGRLTQAMGGVLSVPAVFIFDGQGQEVFTLGGGQGQIGRYFITEDQLTTVIAGLS
ncbi:MAG: TlpA disulfide reductase family protein [Alphaproteobacteria bacterium]